MDYRAHIRARKSRGPLESGFMRFPSLRLRLLDRYILGRFFLIYAGNLISFTSLFVLIDAVLNFDDFLKANGTAVGALKACLVYYSAMTPLVFCQVIAPIVAVTSALFTVTTLQRANELTPILAAGLSLRRTLVPLLGASLGLTIGVFAIQELWIPGTASAIHDALEAKEGRDTFKHFKHRDETRREMVCFRTYDVFKRNAEGVLVLPYGRSEGDHPRSIVHARTAEWVPGEPPRAGHGRWVLRDGTVQTYDEKWDIVMRDIGPGEPPVGRLLEKFAERTLETNLIPEDIEIRREQAVYMTLSALRRKMEASPEQHAWTMKYYSRFAYPVSNFVLVLMGIPVILRFGNRNIIFGAMIAIGIATAYFVLNSVLQDMGIKGAIPARLGAGLATIFFLSLGATLYREMER